MWFTSEQQNLPWQKWMRKTDMSWLFNDAAIIKALINTEQLVEWKLAVEKILGEDPSQCHCPHNKSHIT
jgi:hypothetical protein